MKYNIGIVGSGNVAWHFGHALKKAGHTIEFVSGRNREAVAALASQVNAEALPISTHKSADIIFIALSDSAISTYIEKHYQHHSFLVHTSGATSIDVFRESTNKYGVIYPFQTLTKGVKTEIKETPVCIEANTAESLVVLNDLASSISQKVSQLTSEQRKTLHLTGVLANNFSNYLYGVAFDILKAQGLDPRLLQPIIKETAVKLLDLDPDEAQTGPARRNNTEIINAHLQLLKNKPEVQQLYSLISGLITEKYKNKKK